MPRLKLLKSGNLSEESIQKTVIHRIRIDPLLRKLIIHIPNEGKRSPRYGKLLKDMGLREGVFDLQVLMARRGFIGAWIELKSQDGKLTQAQKEFQKDMHEQNYFTAVCHSIEEAIQVIEWYCFPEAHQSSQPVPYVQKQRLV